ncbi:hypothetical protein [Listeria newyorkensis]|uniref:hypothetical protein n=1 Tax=Listeria newyorkensis TaxID=1497681 RepID=UPI0014858420|nr:hypothetical protein [Listeria newyorkensis]
MDVGKSTNGRVYEVGGVVVFAGKELRIKTIIPGINEQQQSELLIITEEGYVVFR